MPRGRPGHVGVVREHAPRFTGRLHTTCRRFDRTRGTVVASPIGEGPYASYDCSMAGGFCSTRTSPALEHGRGFDTPALAAARSGPRRQNRTAFPGLPRLLRAHGRHHRLMLVREEVYVEVLAFPAGRVFSPTPGSEANDTTGERCCGFSMPHGRPSPSAATDLLHAPAHHNGYPSVFVQRSFRGGGLRMTGNPTYALFGLPLPGFFHPHPARIIWRWGQRAKVTEAAFTGAACPGTRGV